MAGGKSTDTGQSANGLFKTISGTGQKVSSVTEHLSRGRNEICRIVKAMVVRIYESAKAHIEARTLVYTNLVPLQSRSRFERDR